MYASDATWSRIVLVVNSHLLQFGVCIGMAERFFSVHVAAVAGPSGSYGEELLGYICTLVVAKAPAGGKRCSGGWKMGHKKFLIIIIFTVFLITILI